MTIQLKALWDLLGMTGKTNLENEVDIKVHYNVSPKSKMLKCHHFSVETLVFKK